METTTTRHPILAVAVVSLTALGAAATTEAAVITWGAATTISGNSDVSTAGTFIGALSFDTGSVSTTVNGVLFTAPPGSVSGSSGPFSWAGVSQTTSGVTPSAPFSPSYLKLLDSAWQGAAGLSLSLNGLVVGETYAFQIWSSLSAQTSATSTVTAGNSVVLDNNTTDADGGVGQFSIGTFIADNATQTVTVSGFTNGFQLRQVAPAPPISPVTAVPEPASAMVGLMALGLCTVGLGRRQRSVAA